MLLKAQLHEIGFKLVKKYRLQIVCLLFSLASYVYFVIRIDYGIFMDKTEYDVFYLDVLQPPFMIVNGIFIGAFVLSFFFNFLKKNTKGLFVLWLICCLIMYLVNNHYWTVLNHGQGG